MIEAARAARLARPAGWTPTIAVTPGVHPAPLRAAGWALRGTVTDDPFAADGQLLTPQEALEHPALDAVAAGGDADLPALRAAGLLLLLPGPDPLDPERVRAARAVPDAPDAAVGLHERWSPWARTVAAALPLVAPVLQATVRGWPRGPRAAAELVDLAASWCGEVAAVAAAPAPLPAGELPGGAPVAWSLLTASGATVLVSHEGGPLQVRLSCATARLEAGPGGVRWTGGDELPQPAPVDPAVEVARALLPAVGGGEVATDRWPWPADLGDLLVVARVLEALRTSARTATLVRVA